MVNCKTFIENFEWLTTSRKKVEKEVDINKKKKYDRLCSVLPILVQGEHKRVFKVSAHFQPDYARVHSGTNACMILCFFPFV